jgi:DNA-binding NarL/FixJ family response regulator
MPPIRVLVIEDFEPFRRFICSSLKRRPDLQIIGEASDGQEGVLKAEELKPDLIFLDIGLPTLNGIAAARQIRKLAPEAKIIFMTQESSPDVVQEAFNAGGHAYVVKARASIDMIDAVDAVLEGRHFGNGDLRGRLGNG